MAQRYAVSYMHAHCFTCAQGGQRDWKTFETDTDLVKWLNTNNDYVEHRKVYKLEPIHPTKTNMGEKRIVQRMVDYEEPVLEWTIHEKEKL